MNRLTTYQRILCTVYAVAIVVLILSLTVWGAKP